MMLLENQWLVFAVLLLPRDEMHSSQAQVLILLGLPRGCWWTLDPSLALLS